MLSVTPAYALFTNGGFESGNFNGWTLTGTGAPLSGIWNSTTTMPGQTLDVNPYNDNYMAWINNSAGSYHNTTLSQSDVVTATDLSLFVNWGAMLVEPTNNVFHSQDEQPYFSIKVYFNSVLANSFEANASQHDGTWTQAGTNPPGGSSGIMWYKSGTFNYDLTGHVGETLKIELYAEDCGLGGHGGYAFLDGIGSKYDDPDRVPEPTTLLLLGSGLLGLVGMKRKFKK